MAYAQANNSIPAMVTLYQPLEKPVVVVGPQFFSAQFPVDLTVKTKLLSIGESDFGVTDNNGTHIFKVKGRPSTIRERRYLLDAAGNVLASLQQKIITAHRRWQVFRGDKKEQKDLLFIAKKSSLIQFRTELDVFLATNNSGGVPDFKVKGSWKDRSCAVYLGDTNTVVAQMHRRRTLPTAVFEKGNFAVTVYPNVDYAFIVALIVVLDEINEDRHEPSCSTLFSSVHDS